MPDDAPGAPESPEQFQQQRLARGLLKLVGHVTGGRLREARGPNPYLPSPAEVAELLGLAEAADARCLQAALYDVRLGRARAELEG